MTAKQIEDTLKTVNQTVKANAKRPVATRPLADSGKCTHKGCTKCGRK